MTIIMSQNKKKIYFLYNAVGLYR